ncbi:MAG: hypothetical protein DSM106950_23235 [Stigonema ocellatum SAG 48.90 = DSM 106950]|nr:hypothetical protein [Stigonema ocellatum SAG 48.90 = DSM 106950]
MPLESQKGEINNRANSLAKQSPSEENQPEIKKNEAENAYVEKVIAEANQQLNETEKPIQSTVMITEAQEKMAFELRQALGLGFEVTLNSAVKYALFYAQNEEVPVNKLEEYPSNLGSHSIKIKVTPDTLHRLKESGAANLLSECVVVGIQLLYRQLIHPKTNHSHL